MGEQTAAAIRWQHSKHYPEGKTGYLYVSVPGILASPNTTVPCPCVVLMIHWTVNISALPSDALFPYSFCTVSGSWPSVTDITVMSTKQTPWLTAKSATICCPCSLASKPDMIWLFYNRAVALPKKIMFYFNWAWIVEVWYFYFWFALTLFIRTWYCFKRLFIQYTNAIPEFLCEICFFYKVNKISLLILKILFTFFTLLLRVTVRVGLMLREMDTAANCCQSPAFKKHYPHRLPLLFIYIIYYERFAFKTVEATPPTANEVY